jgi:hypothetical protein
MYTSYERATLRKKNRFTLLVEALYVVFNFLDISLPAATVFNNRQWKDNSHKNKQLYTGP